MCIDVDNFVVTDSQALMSNPHVAMHKRYSSMASARIIYVNVDQWL